MIKINTQYRKKTPKIKIRLKALRDVVHPHEERFIPDESLNEPEYKEGFSLPWISHEGLRLNDRFILDWCHRVEVGLLVLSMAAVYLLENKQDWVPVFQTVLLVVVLAGFYRTVLFEKLTKNLQAIVSKTKGEFTPGNAILATPPKIRFDYQNQDCYVRSVIDQNFQLVLEVSSYFGKEFEFRIERPAEGDSGYLVLGHDKAAVQAILNDQKVNHDLQDIFKSFNYMSYGKDGMMHIGESFDGQLTDPQIVFEMLDRMISIGKLLKLHEG